MSRLFDGGNDRLSYVTAAIVNAAPLSMACWIKPSRTSHTTEEHIMRASAAGATNQIFVLGINTSNQVFGRSRTSASSDATSGATTITDTNWHHIVFVTASTSSRFVYVDGVKSSEETTTRAVTSASITAFFMGADSTSTPTLEFFGNIAYPALWNVALSDGNVASLYNSGAGAVPSSVASPVAYWPLTANTDPEVDSIGGFNVTTSASGELPAFSSDNPFSVGGGASDIPQFMNVYARRRRAG